MAKRISKAEKEAADKQALRRRVLDMAFGAFGWYVGAEAIDPASADHAGMFGSMSPDSIGRWIGAVAIHLMGVDRNAQPSLLNPHCLADWDDLNGIVDTLYGCGVRAEGKCTTSE